MKVRTDFVTNSSSSSFVVNLSMELKNGTSLTIDTGDCSGDFESKDLCVKAEDASKTKIFEEAVFFDESDDFFYYDVNDFVGDIQFGHLNLAEVLCCKDISESTKKIEQAFLTVGALDAFEEDNEDESAIFEQYDEATKEVILQAKEKIEKIAEFLHIFFSENIKSKEDIKKISVSMEASGRGEFLAEPVELLRKLFGWNDRDDVCDILEEKEDEETTLENLKELSCMNGMSEQAILELIRFWKQCDNGDYIPGMCLIVQKLEDGEVKLSISVDDDCW